MYAYNIAISGCTFTYEFPVTTNTFVFAISVYTGYAVVEIIIKAANKMADNFIDFMYIICVSE